MKYGITDLLPLVTELSEKYNGKATTSVTYETAQQLLGAVLYCLSEQENYGNSGRINQSGTEKACLADAETVTVREVYRRGYQLVLNRVEEARVLYNEIMEGFQSYGNRCYEETLCQGIPEFFKWYDARFRPQDHRITLDYPVRIPMEQFQGIDAVFAYLQCISAEQKFLGRLKKTYVSELLQSDSFDHREMIENVPYLVWKKFLAALLAGAPLRAVHLTEEDYERIASNVRAAAENLTECLEDHMNTVIEQHYGNDETLRKYFCGMAADIAAELRNGVENGSLGKVV